MPITVTELDSNQVLKTVFDIASGAVKTIPASATSFAIELDQADGDSVLTYPSNIGSKASITSASTGVILPAASCVGMKSFNIFSKTTTNIVGSQVITLEISPHDTDNVWFATSLTITPSGTAGTVVSGTLTSLVARRVRLSIAAAITSGAADIYLVAESV